MMLQKIKKSVASVFAHIIKLEDIKDGWISIHGKGNKTRELPIER